MKDEFFVVIDTVGIYRESVESMYLPFVRFFFLRRKFMLQFSDVRDEIDSSDMWPWKLSAPIRNETD